MNIKDASLKNALNRGFTLIELMIVIVILGVLMGTILPRLTGAQARARDTGRIADMNTLSQALETYYDDYGSYPVIPAGATNCLNETAGSPGDLLSEYLKGGTIPTPPTSSQVTTVFTISCTGEYFYAPLTNRGLANNGYVLASDMETYQKANAITTVAPLNAALAAGATVASVSAIIEDSLADLKTADTIATNTIYIVVN